MKAKFVVWGIAFCTLFRPALLFAQPKFSLTPVGKAETSLNSVTCTVHQIDGANYVYSGGSDDKIDIFKVDAEGKIKNIARTQVSGKHIRGLITDKIEGKDFLFAGIKGGDAVEVFEINGDGTLNRAFILRDTESTYLGIVITLQVVHMAESSYLFVGGLEKSPGLSSFKIFPDGHLKHVQSMADTKELFMDGVIAMSIHRIEGKTLLFTGGFHDNGLSSFQVYEDGHFENRDNIGDDHIRYLNGTYPVISATLSGRHYVVVGHRHHIYYEPTSWVKDRDNYYYHGDAVSVFIINEQGELVPRSVFKGNSETLIKGQTRLQSLPLDDKHELVAVATRDDRSIQLCVLDHKGRLIDAGKLFTDIPVYYGLTGKRIGDQLFLFVGSTEGKAFVSYRLDPVD
ncbi:stress protein [Fulvivirgaceae bacterium BMA12]|uniref:Stress protein n=1 Tax=Agaribacillus aureus TaxID=3051825 RepID=A0ABT8LDL8_9BACT|nr:stress protein [Fulvivirgaceae bacterium BMA12]